MERRNVVKLGVFGAIAAGVVGVAGRAFAFHRGGNRGEWMKKRITGKIDDALDAAGVTGPARDVVYAERDKVFAAFEKMRGGRKEHMDKVLSLFQADTIAKSDLAALRQEHLDRMNEIGDVIQTAIVNVHDALDAKQRASLVTYVKAQRERFHGGHDE